MVEQTYKNNNQHFFLCTTISITNGTFFNSINTYFFRFNSEILNYIIETLLQKGDTGQNENLDTEIKTNGLLFSILFRSQCLTAYTNYKLFIAITKESDKTNTKSSINESVAAIKVEQHDYHDSIVDISEPDNKSELVQHVCEIVSDSYYYKK